MQPSIGSRTTQATATTFQIREQSMHTSLIMALVSQWTHQRLLTTKFLTISSILLKYPPKTLKEHLALLRSSSIKSKRSKYLTQEALDNHLAPESKITLATTTSPVATVHQEATLVLISWTLRFTSNEEAVAIIENPLARLNSLTRPWNLRATPQAFSLS